jgi:hypothetical protein
MSEPLTAKAQVQEHLHAISLLLRSPHRLSPEAKAVLADFVDELGAALDAQDAPSAEVARLTECATNLLHAVQEQHEPNVLEAAEERLEHAAVAVESRSPALANLTRRLAEMLSNLGI